VGAWKKEPPRLRLTFKDSRQLVFLCSDSEELGRMHEIISSFAFAKGVENLYAFRYGSFECNTREEKEYGGWSLYDIGKEFRREGLEVGREAEMGLRFADNGNWELSETYTELLVVPRKINDEELKKCAGFRTKQRFPAMTYLAKYGENCFSALFRCSQCMGGVRNVRSKSDELMMQYIGELFGS
jgi:hypothetical protein